MNTPPIFINLTLRQTAGVTQGGTPTKKRGFPKL